MRYWISILLVTLSTQSSAGGDHGKPRLNLRATPRVAFTPVSVMTMAELVGGEAVEDYYCPSVQWDWGDGSVSAHEADCPPFESGAAQMERRFSARHVYRASGDYEIRVTLRRVERPVATASVSVTLASR